MNNHNTGGNSSPRNENEASEWDSLTRLAEEAREKHRGEKGYTALLETIDRFDRQGAQSRAEQAQPDAEQIENNTQSKSATDKKAEKIYPVDRGSQSAERYMNREGAENSFNVQELKRIAEITGRVPDDKEVVQLNLALRYKEYQKYKNLYDDSRKKNTMIQQGTLEDMATAKRELEEAIYLYDPSFREINQEIERINVEQRDAERRNKVNNIREIYKAKQSAMRANERRITHGKNFAKDNDKVDTEGRNWVKEYQDRKKQDEAISVKYDNKRNNIYTKVAKDLTENLPDIIQDIEQQEIFKTYELNKDSDPEPIRNRRAGFDDVGKNGFYVDGQIDWGLYPHVPDVVNNAGEPANKGATDKPQGENIEDIIKKEAGVEPGDTNTGETDADAVAKAEAEERAKIEAEERAKIEAEEREKREAEEREKREAEEREKREAEDIERERDHVAEGREELDKIKSIENKDERKKGLIDFINRGKEKLTIFSKWRNKLGELFRAGEEEKKNLEANISKLNNETDKEKNPRLAEIEELENTYAENQKELEAAKAEMAQIASNLNQAKLASKEPNDPQLIEDKVLREEYERLVKYYNGSKFRLGMATDAEKTWRDSFDEEKSKGLAHRISNWHEINNKKHLADSRRDEAEKYKKDVEHYANKMNEFWDTLHDEKFQQAIGENGRKLLYSTEKINDENSERLQNEIVTFWNSLSPDNRERIAQYSYHQRGSNIGDPLRTWLQVNGHFEKYSNPSAS